MPFDLAILTVSLSVISPCLRGGQPPLFSPRYTTVLQQGSGTFVVESVLTTCVPREGGKLVVLANGAYGKRICHLAEWLGIEVPCPGVLPPPFQDSAAS